MSSEFLGYFMPHKVLAGKDTMKAAGKVTKKLVNGKGVWKNNS